MTNDASCIHPRRVSRRHVLTSGVIATGLATLPGGQAYAAQAEPEAGGILIAVPDPGPSLALIDPSTGKTRSTFDVGPRPDSAWRTPMPGIGLVRSETALSIVDSTNGSVLPV